MTSSQWVGRVIRPVVIIGGVIPLAVLIRRFLADDFGANPAEEIEHFTGMTTLAFLLGSLVVTPLRRVTGINPLIRIRKPIGLWAFGYATIHMSCYLVFDQSLLWREIIFDIAKRPYITVGFSAWVILLALAVTSNARAVRRLGKRWTALHRLVYVAATLGVLHFLWLVKLDTSTPVALAFLLIVLLAFRIPACTPTRAAPPPG